MKYIITNSMGIDKLEVETNGNRIVNVTALVPPKNGEPLTAEKLQKDLLLYTKGSDKTIEEALNVYIGSYESIRRVED